MLLLGLLAKTVMEKSWKFSRLFCQDQDQDQDSGSQDQDQDQDFIFVLEAPRDQDFGLEDYITALLITLFFILLSVPEIATFCKYFSVKHLQYIFRGGYM